MEKFTEWAIEKEINECADIIVKYDISEGL